MFLRKEQNYEIKIEDKKYNTKVNIERTMTTNKTVILFRK